MAVITATSSWQAFTAAAGGTFMQVRGGRIYIAATNAPAAEDWLVLPDGAVMEFVTSGYLKKVAEAATVALLDK